ncbi:MmgE/PrpD family protein [Rhizohabitans arisaemae]|uniref:MmgE/PrpD family protein n=1 Tax=Rhizohabitans arisaemae TaxID=2720610 RepID=UPI0024B156DF|nr:MmgE/PrpD family protein [Rhizohabitans arisaemae]
MQEKPSRTAEAMASLAEFVAGVRGEDIPASTRRRAARVVADTFGVGIRGSRTLPARRLIAAHGTEGAARLLAPGFPTASYQEAALLNAIFICSTELDEGARPTGHPAMHVLPPLLALAQAEGMSGYDFLTAFILGYEVQGRLQRAVRLRDRVHCHGNLGHAAVAAGLARLLGRPAPIVLTAMNGAAGVASATSYGSPYSGADMHSATPTLSGSAGFLALRLADAGFTSNGEAVPEVFGRLLGSSVDDDELTRDLGEKWAVDAGYVKFHSTCGHVHPVLDALVEAFGNDGTPWRMASAPDPESIEAVTVTVSARAAELGHLPPPGSALSARFSIRYATAALLAHGHAGVDAFEPDALADPRIRALASRVAIVADPALDELFPDIHRAGAEVRFRDGRIVTGWCDNPYGNDKNPASDHHIRRKFLQLAGAALPTGDAERLWDTLLDCDRLPDVRRLTPA